MLRVDNIVARALQMSTIEETSCCHIGGERHSPTQSWDSRHQSRTKDLSINHIAAAIKDQGVKGVLLVSFNMLLQVIKFLRAKYTATHRTRSEHPICLPSKDPSTHQRVSCPRWSICLRSCATEIQEHSDKKIVKLPVPCTSRNTQTQ